MLAPVTHILGLTTIVRHRLLPINGQVVTRVGQKVSAADVVAEAPFSREHVIIDVARKLGISPAKADKRIKVKQGDRVKKGDTIANVSGTLARPIVAPQGGRVVLSGGGQVLIETGEDTIELLAGYNGTVQEVIEKRGVIIKTTGALIQGAWGNGRVESGLLLNLLEKPNDILERSQLEVSQRGGILLAGHVEDGEVLRNAAELPVRGLILSSISPALIPLAFQMRYPIIVIEGFGPHPLNQQAFKLLTTNSKRELSLNAEPPQFYEGTRPEIVIPLPVSQEPAEPRNIEAFAPDQTVRVIHNPRAGEIGTLINIRPGLTRLQNGVHAPAADVRMADNEMFIIPLANLEIIG